MEVVATSTNPGGQDKQESGSHLPPRPKSMDLGASIRKECLSSRQEVDSRLHHRRKSIELGASSAKEFDSSLPPPPRPILIPRKSMESGDSSGKQHLPSIKLGDSDDIEKKLPPQSKQGFESREGKSSRRVWDCESTLYDSFELNSFKRDLDSAISCRTMSMPHLSSDRRAPLSQIQTPPVVVSKKPSKLSRTLNKLLRSVFKTKTNHSSAGAVYRVQEQQGNMKEGFYVVYDKSGSLTTIPEVVPHEFSGFSPEIGSLVRRTGSERFARNASIGISCA